MATLNIGTENYSGITEVSLPCRGMLMAIFPSYPVGKGNKNTDFLKVTILATLKIRILSPGRGTFWKQH